MRKITLLIIALLAVTAVAFAQNQTINGNLTVANTNNGGIRIGKIGSTGNLNVAYGSLASQYNLDFTGYRDNASDQIGARIAALRFNRHLANSALVQKTGLAFYTNPLGWNTGTTDLLERMRITPEGNVGIGTINPTSKLEVAGTIRAKEVKIEATGWADFVFSKDYDLPKLSEVEKHINDKQHLPGIPSEKEVLENGVNVVDMQARLLQKVEELTLYVIEQNKEIQVLKEENKAIRSQLKTQQP